MSRINTTIFLSHNWALWGQVPYFYNKGEHTPLGIAYNSPLHICLLHSLVSSGVPEHILLGSHLRVLVWMPPLHGDEHRLHPLHSPHLPENEQFVFGSVKTMLFYQ